MSASPILVAHADWGSAPGKRRLARARLGAGDRYHALPPEPVGLPSELLTRLVDEAAGGAVLLGFDFPIGLPLAYAKAAGITSFVDVLPRLGTGEWAQFYAPAGQADEIGLYRPFYPLRPGGARRQHLVDGLRLPDQAALWRRCDVLTFGRGSAAPLFWTLGANQVGKAAIIGWRDVLAPALRAGRPPVALWPFAGPLSALLREGWIVVAETYPAECYHHLGLTDRGKRWSKRRHADRVALAPRLLAWAASAGVELAPALRAAIRDGFGPAANGDDAFDAVVGLFGMLGVLLGHRPAGEPSDEEVRCVEGWILGQSTEPGNPGRPLVAQD
ncbi:MAG: hypothetical protein ACUVSS_11665 [Anaerolineae bacterium]